MTGTTPHGIRYPDAATKVKNLGGELATMAGDIDALIETEIGASSPVFQQKAADAVAAAVPPAVTAEIAGRGMVQSSDPRLPGYTEDPAFLQLDKDERRRVSGGIDTNGVYHMFQGVQTPYAGLPSPSAAVVGGHYDPVRRRFAHDAIGPDGRFLPETIADIAAQIQGGAFETKHAPHILTGSAGTGGFTSTVAAADIRHPVKVPVTVIGAPTLVFRNRNDRGAVVYPGAVSITGIWWGRAARDSFGLMTGGFAAAPVQVSGPVTTPANGDAIRIPLNIPAGIQAGEDWILSYGYTCADGQTNHVGIGGGWMGTTPGNASAINPPLTQVQQLPFDLWLDCDIPKSTPMVGWFGDSLTLATASTFPIYDCAARQHAFAEGVWPVIYAHHGSTMTDWTTGDSYRWTKYGSPVCTSAVWAIGSNNVFNGETLDSVRQRFVALHPIAVNRLGTSRIYTATIMPRNGAATDPAKETVRVAYNAWLYQRPMGTHGVFDFAKSVESAVGTVRADYIAGDSVHLTTQGYAQNARAITARLA